MNSMEQQSKIFTADEVANMLRVHRVTVIRLIKKGDIKGFKVGDQWRVWEDDLQAYIGGTANGES
jgi:excisionase family DNA binding protein